MRLSAAPRTWLALSACVVLLCAASDARAAAIQFEAVGKSGMVASAHSLATQAGIDILKRGGNAFDAAVAVSAALNVVEPSRSGLGGVGYMTLYVARTGEVVSLQMTGAAPLAATPDKFASKRDQEAGYLAGVVPGSFGGWVHLLERYGTVSLGEVLRPATHYAENGFPVDSYLRETLEDASSNLAIFPSTARVFLAGGQPPRTGELLVQKDLAHTFRRLAAAEADALRAGKDRKAALLAAYDLFYKGDLAKEMVAFYQENGGLFSARDLAEYAPVWAKPVHTRYRDYDIYSNGPTSRGGIQTLMSLNLLEAFDLRKMGHNSPEYLHLLAETIKLVNADVYKYVADPKFAAIPLEELLSKEYAAERRKLIGTEKASPYAEAGNPASLRTRAETSPALRSPDRGATAPREAALSSYEDDPNTTHFDIVDQAGNAVAGTPTTGTFGTKVVVGNTGVIFHNATRYGSFSPYKDDANFIDGGKTPLINNSPLIALRNGKLFMLWGTPGGEGIGQMQIQTFLNVVEFAMSIQEAVEAPRIELRARPDFYRPGAEVSIGFESRVPEATRKGLEARGNKIRVEEQPFAQVFGGMQGILRNEAFGTLTGGADPRRGGCAIGY
jgi:gamma-glutamyltranspeptidase/glutathione hydrolase